MLEIIKFLERKKKCNTKYVLSVSFHIIWEQRYKEVPLKKLRRRSSMSWLKERAWKFKTIIVLFYHSKCYCYGFHFYGMLLIRAIPDFCH